MPAFISPTRLYLTADRDRVVPDGDPEAAFLLVPAGGSLPMEEAARYGLLDQADPAPEATAPEGKALAGPPATKAVKDPPRTKARGG